MFQNPSVSHIYDEAGTRLNIKQLLSGEDKAIWEKAMSMEISCLAQGNHYGVKATDAIDFIPYAIIPKGMKITYASFVANLIGLDVSLVEINWTTWETQVPQLPILLKPKSCSAE